MEKLEWNGLKAEVIEPGQKIRIKTAGCTCGSGTCKTARNHKCTCSCGGVNHSIAFKERNRISSLDEYEEGEEETPNYIS